MIVAMSKKKCVMLGILFLILAYLSLMLFIIVIENSGTETLGGFVVPLCLTVFYVFICLFGYFLIKAKVVCKLIRFFMYFMGTLGVVGLIIYWMYMLFR